MWVISAEWAGTDDHKWLVLVGGIWTQRLGRDRKTTLENWLGNGIWFPYPQCITIRQHKMTLMCVCVCLWVCLLVVMFWMFLWEQELWTEENETDSTAIWMHVSCKYSTGIKIKHGGDVQSGKSRPSLGGRHLNSLRTNWRQKKPNILLKIFSV